MTSCARTEGVGYQEVREAFHTEGFSRPFIYHSGNKRDKVSYSFIRKRTEGVEDLKYSTALDCGYFSTVWLSRFAGTNKAVGLALVRYEGHKSNHYLNFYIDTKGKLRLLEPQKGKDGFLEDVSKVLWVFYP